MNTFLLSIKSKHINIYCVALLISIASSISEPSYAAERKTYTTIGNRSCKMWMSDRQKSLTGTGLEKLSGMGSTSWFLGFLSSLNAGIGGDIDVLVAIDADTALLWLDRYCNQNPNDKITDGAYKLFLELLKIEVAKREKKNKGFKK